MKIEKTHWELELTVLVRQDELTALLEVADQHKLGVNPQLTTTKSSNRTAYRVTLTSTGTKTSIRKGIAALAALQTVVDTLEGSS